MRYIIAVVCLLMLSGCAGSPARIHYMDPSELQQLNDKQLRKALGHKWSDHQKLMNEAKRRGYTQEEIAESLPENSPLQASYMNSKQLKDVSGRTLVRSIKFTHLDTTLIEEEILSRHLCRERDFDLIRDKKIGVGMCEEGLYVSWGTPDKINKSVGSYGVHKQCIYRKYKKSTYVYVKNGKVTGWQN